MAKSRTGISGVGTLSEADAKELYGGLLEYMLFSCDRDIGELWEQAPGVPVDADTLGLLDMPQQDMECGWCLSSGNFVGLPCPFCAGGGRHPTPRTYRLLQQKMAALRHPLNENLVYGNRLIHALTDMSDGEYELFRAAHDQYKDMDADRLTEMGKIRAHLEESTAPNIEEIDAVIEQLRDLERRTRLAERAVEVTYKPRAQVAAPVVRVQDVCASCGKTAVVWAEDGTPYCKKHGRKFGVVRRAPKFKRGPAQPTATSPDPESSAPQMTRPFRFVGGPEDGKLHPVQKGDLDVTINGARYERRGHVFEHVG